MSFEIMVEKIYEHAERISLKNGKSILELGSSLYHFVDSAGININELDKNEKEKLLIVIKNIMNFNFSQNKESTFNYFLGENLQNEIDKKNIEREQRQRMIQIKKEQDHFNFNQRKENEKEKLLVQNTRSEKYEYAVERIKNNWTSDIIEENTLAVLLNQYADNGWRVISMIPMSMYSVGASGNFTSHNAKEVMIVTFEKRVRY